MNSLAIENYQEEVIGSSNENTKPGLPVFCGFQEQDLLSVKYKKKRKIAKSPFKVLDAPLLQDDFYLNLVDWSA